MCTAGQSEIVILLELTEEEEISEILKPPADVFLHLHKIYQEALKGSNFLKKLRYLVCLSSQYVSSNAQVLKHWYRFVINFRVVDNITSDLSDLSLQQFQIAVNKVLGKLVGSYEVFTRSKI